MPREAPPPPPYQEPTSLLPQQIRFCQITVSALLVQFAGSPFLANLHLQNWFKTTFLLSQCVSLLTGCFAAGTDYLAQPFVDNHSVKNETRNGSISNISTTSLPSISTASHRSGPTLRSIQQAWRTFLRRYLLATKLFGNTIANWWKNLRLLRQRNSWPISIRCNSYLIATSMRLATCFVAVIGRLRKYKDQQHLQATWTLLELSHGVLG